MKDENRVVRCPEDWSKKELKAAWDEEMEMTKRLAKERDEFKEKYNALLWQLSRARELMHVLTQVVGAKVE